MASTMPSKLLWTETGSSFASNTGDSSLLTGAQSMLAEAPALQVADVSHMQPIA